MKAIVRSSMFVHRAAIGAALFVALGLRLLALAAASGRVPFGDPLHYLYMAHSVLAGKGLVVVQGTVTPFVSRALFPPVYPLLLAAVGTILPLTSSTIAFVNSLIDVGAALLLYRFAELIGSPKVALPAALAYLCWPSLALAAPLANKEGLSLFLLLGAVVAFLERAAGGGRRWIVLCGLSAGLMVLTQPALAPVLPILFLLLVGRFRDRGAWLVASFGAAFCAMFVLLPWWIRNYLLLDAFVPLTTSNGYALWVGAQPSGGFKWQPYPGAWLAKSEVELSRTAAIDALQIIFDDPWSYLYRCLVKLPASFLRPNLAVLNLAYMEPPPWPRLLRSKVVLLIPMLVELAPVSLALAGLVTLRRSLPARMLLGCIAASLLFGIWFEFGERHRQYMTPFVLLLAVMVVADLRRSFGGRPLP